MEWSMVFTIVGTNIAMIGVIGAFIIWAFSKLDSDVKSLTNEIKDENKRLEERITQANMRMDGVYNILLKRTEL